MTLVLIALGCVLIGVAIGLTGIGGIALVPLLVAAGDIGVAEAVPACLAAFVITGVIGLFGHRRALDGAGRDGVSLTLATGVGAFAGAGVFTLLPPLVPALLLSAMMVAAGIANLRERPPIAATPRLRPGADPVLWASVGVVVGVGSALTGTGGPVMLVPLLLSLGVAPHRSVGLAQLVMIPIGVMATIGNLLFGRVDLVLAGLIGFAMAGGAFAGARLAHRLPAARLLRVLALALIMVGLAFGLMQLQDVAT